MGRMGPVVGGVEHEGWVVPLFADGAAGTGTSGPQGVLVRLPGRPEQEWRPDAEVTGWAAACECGWRGRPWQRVTARREGSRSLRRLHVAGPWAHLDDVDEDEVMREWDEHVAPAVAVEAVQAAAEQAGDAVQQLDEAVQAARAAGASWADVGRATGMTRQSANERWSARVTR